MMGLLVVLVTAPVALARPQETPGGPVAVIESTNLRLVLDVRVSSDPALNTPRRIVFERADAQTGWRLVGQSPLFTIGTTPLVLPPAWWYEAHGRAVDAVLHGLDASIANVVGDRVTVISFAGGEVAICIWRSGRVEEAWFAGTAVPQLVAAALDPNAMSCEVGLSICCANTGVSQSSIACVAALACTATREAACECLLASCLAVQQVPPAGSFDSCTIHNAFCSQTDELAAPSMNEALVLWVVDLLRAADD
jgi:hypothetical protein